MICEFKRGQGVPQAFGFVRADKRDDKVSRRAFCECESDIACFIVGVVAGSKYLPFDACYQSLQLKLCFMWLTEVQMRQNGETLRNLTWLEQ